MPGTGHHGDRMSGPPKDARTRRFEQEYTARGIPPQIAERLARQKAARKKRTHG